MSTKLSRIYILVLSLLFVAGCNVFSTISVPKDFGAVKYWLPEIFKPTKYAYTGLYSDADIDAYIFSVKKHKEDSESLFNILKIHLEADGWRNIERNYYYRIKTTDGIKDYILFRIAAVDENEVLIGFFPAIGNMRGSKVKGAEKDVFYSDNGKVKYARSTFWPAFEKFLLERI